MERYNIMANKLYQVLETPVSTLLLSKLNDKEMALLEVRLRSLKYYTGILDEDDVREYKEIIETIKSILNNGKARLPKKTYHGTGQYNKLTK